MKQIVFTLLLLFVSFEIAFGDSNCTDEDITQITTCYQDIYGNMTFRSVLGLSVPFVLTQVRKDFYHQICETQQQLSDCIGKPILERCFNVEDIRKLPFSRLETYAKTIIAAFLETDYYCDKLFKLSDDDHKCLEDVLQKNIETCYFPITGSAHSQCHAINKKFNCIIEDSYKKCGKVVGCFQQKTATLSRCYFNNSCRACGGISFNNNPMKEICDDDSVEVTDI